MIRVTVGEVVVTWSQEYGFTIAGGEAEVEEIQPRSTVLVPVVDLSPMPDRLRTAALPSQNETPKACIVCGHRDHGAGPCDGKGPDGDECDCYGWVPPGPPVITPLRKG